MITPINKDISISTAAFFPRDITEIFPLVKSVGVSTIELMPQDISECKPEFAREIKKLDPELWIYSIHFPLILLQFFFNPYPRAIKTGEQISRDLIEMAGELNTKLIVMHSPRIEKGEQVFRGVSVDNIRFLCELAAQKDITIAIENNPGSWTSSPELLMAFIKELDCKNLGTVIDTTEAMEADINPVEFLDKMNQVSHLHLSDFSDKSKHLPLGQGGIDWPAIVKLMKQRNFRGKWVIELSYRYLLKNPEPVLKESVIYLNQLLNND